MPSTDTAIGAATKLAISLVPAVGIVRIMEVTAIAIAPIAMAHATVPVAFIRNYSPGVQSPHGGLWGFPLKRLNQCVQQIDALLA